MKKPKTNKYFPEVRELAVRMVQEHRVDVVLGAVVALPVLLRPAGAMSFCVSLAGVLPHSTGTVPCLTRALSSSPLRWIGTGTKVASMIWPLLSSTPRSAGAWFKRSNRGRMKESRSVTWYCSRSSDRLCSRCRMRSLNMRTRQTGLRPAVLLRSLASERAMTGRKISQSMTASIHSRGWVARPCSNGRSGSQGRAGCSHAGSITVREIYFERPSSPAIKNR